MSLIPISCPLRPSHQLHIVADFKQGHITRTAPDVRMMPSPMYPLALRPMHRTPTFRVTMHIQPLAPRPTHRATWRLISKSRRATTELASAIRRCTKVSTLACRHLVPLPWRARRRATTPKVSAAATIIAASQWSKVLNG